MVRDIRRCLAVCPEPSRPGLWIGDVEPNGDRLGTCWAAAGRREWALRQGWGGRLVRQEQAQGMLVAALGLLDGYYGLGRGKPAWATSYWAGGGAGVAPPNQPRK
jgi:hypothetical protein